MKWSEISVEAINEDLNHAAPLLFHTTRLLSAAEILATGILEPRTDDKASAATPGKGISLTRSYQFALQYRGRSRPKIIFVFRGLHTRPVDYWRGDAARRRVEAEEWYPRPIPLQRHLVSINSNLNLDQFSSRVAEALSDPDAQLLFGDLLPAVTQIQKDRFRAFAPLWNVWQPVRGLSINH